MAWLMQVFMISLVGITFLMFSNKFASSIARVDFNGDDSADIEGAVTGKLQQGAGLTAGALAGGVGAGVAGGSIMKGAAVGGFTGSRGGKPGSAALLGMAAGKASSEKTKAKKAEKEHERRMEEDPVYADKFDANKQNENKKAVKDEDKAMANSSARYDNLTEQMNQASDPKERKRLSAERDKIAQEWVNWSKNEDNLEVDANGKKTPRKIPQPNSEELAKIIGEKAGGTDAFRPMGKKIGDAIQTAVEEGVNDAATATSGMPKIILPGDADYTNNPLEAIRRQREAQGGSMPMPTGTSMPISLDNLRGDADERAQQTNMSTRTGEENERISMPLPDRREKDSEGVAATAVLATAMTQVAASTASASENLQDVANRLNRGGPSRPSVPPNNTDI
jgi:hypothetical protein